MAWSYFSFNRFGLRFSGICAQRGGKSKGGWPLECTRGFSAVYSSTRPGTAVEEAFQLAADFQLAPDDLKPRITCGIEWELSSVLDLTVADLPAWLKYLTGCARISRRLTTVALKRYARHSAEPPETPVLPA